MFSWVAAGFAKTVLHKKSPKKKAWWSYTLPKFNSSPLKNHGWTTILSFWGPGIFSGATCIFEGPKVGEKDPHPSSWRAASSTPTRCPSAGTVRQAHLNLRPGV